MCKIWYGMGCKLRYADIWGWGWRGSTAGQHTNSLQIAHTCPPHFDQSLSALAALMSFYSIYCLGFSTIYSQVQILENP